MPRKKKYQEEDTVSINKHDLFVFVLSTARYAWPRSSVAVGEAADLIKRYAQHIKNDDLAIILKDLRDAQKEWVKKEKSTSLKQFQCDRDTLLDLEGWLAAKLGTNSLNREF